MFTLRSTNIMTPDDVLQLIRVKIESPLLSSRKHQNVDDLVVVISRLTYAVKQIDATLLCELYNQLKDVYMGSASEEILDIVLNDAMCRCPHLDQQVQTMTDQAHGSTHIVNLNFSDINPLRLVESRICLVALLRKLRDSWQDNIGFWCNHDYIIERAISGDLCVCIRNKTVAGFYIALDEQMPTEAAQRSIKIIQSFEDRGTGMGRLMVEHARIEGLIVVAYRPLKSSLDFWRKVYVPVDEASYQSTIAFLGKPMWNLDLPVGGVDRLARRGAVCLRVVVERWSMAHHQRLVRHLAVACSRSGSVVLQYFDVCHMTKYDDLGIRLSPKTFESFVAVKALGDDWNQVEREDFDHDCVVRYRLEVMDGPKICLGFRIHSMCPWFIPMEIARVFECNPSCDALHCGVSSIVERRGFPFGYTR